MSTRTSAVRAGIAHQGHAFQKAGDEALIASEFWRFVEWSDVRGVLVVGSGNLVHNLHAYGWGRRQIKPFDWAVRFEGRARELLLADHHDPLIAYETLGRDAALSVPTPDHYLPLLYVIAQQREEDEVSFPVEGFDGGSISMLSVKIG